MAIGGMCSVILFYFGLWQFGLSLLIITIAWIIIKYKYLKNIEEEKSTILDGSLLVVLGTVFIFISILFLVVYRDTTIFPLYIISLLLVVIGVNLFAIIYGDDVMCILFMGLNLLSPVLVLYGLIFLSHISCINTNVIFAPMYLIIALWFFGLPAGVLGYYSNSKMLMNIMLGLWMVVMIMMALFLVPMGCGTLTL